MWEVAFHIICKDDASKMGKVFMNTFTNSQICLNQRRRKLKEAWKISLETLLDYLDLFFAVQLCKMLIYLTNHLLKLDCVFAWMHAENRRGIRLHRKKSRCYVKVVFFCFLCSPSHQTASIVNTRIDKMTEKSKDGREELTAITATLECRLSTRLQWQDLEQCAINNNLSEA